MLRLIRNAVLIGGGLICVMSAWSWYQTGRFWVPAFLVSGSQSVVEAVSEVPITSSTKQPSFNSVSPPTEASYKWLVDGVWHYGANPPAGVKAIKISQGAK